MKRLYQPLALLILIISTCLLQACETSSNYLSIDYMEPGKVLFPERIETLTLIDNTKIQDLSNKSENLKALKLTTAEVFEGFVAALAETEYYNKLIIADDQWRSKGMQHISKEQFEKMGEKIQTDAIIALEELNIRDINTTFFYPEPYTDYRIHIQPVLQIYNTKTNSVNKLIDSDTVSVTEGIFLAQQLSKNHLYTPDNYPHSGAYMLGQSLAQLLAPHWKTAERMIYTDTPVFKSANKLFDQNKLEVALQEYQSIANKNEKPIYSIKAAYNAAVTYELMDQLDNAYEWATKSLKLAQEHFKRSDTQLSFELYEKNEIYFNSLYYTFLLTNRLKNKAVLEQQMKRFVEQK